MRLPEPETADITAPAALSSDLGVGAGAVTARAATETVVGTDVASIAGEADGSRRRARRSAKKHRGRWWALGVTLAVLALAAAVVAGAARVDRPLAQPRLTPGLPASLLVAGTSPTLPWPAAGQGAVSVPSLGYAAQSGPESSVPVASLTKMTTALVILEDHPVAPGAEGPPITVTSADVAEYDNELHNDESTLPIEVGEVLTERQMLEAMLTQSANDIAYSLALWDAGTLPAFVAKMNATAARLGATASHYVDASGYDPGSVSTAADCLRIAAAAMAVPTFAEVVGMSSVTLPLVGTEPNIVTEIGSHNVVGIKSGYSSEAKACMVLAADRVVAGRSVLVLAAVLTQPVPPPVEPTTTTTRPQTAGATGSTSTTTTIPQDDLQVPDPFRYTRPVIGALLDAAEAGVVPTTVVSAGQTAALVSAEWGGEPHRARVVAARGATLAGWPGQRVTAVTKLVPVGPGSGSGRTVGQAVYALGTEVDEVPLKLATTVPEPSWWWRLVHD